MADITIRPEAELPRGQLNYWEGSVLAALVRIADPNRILELGTHKGVSTEYIAEASDAPIVTVDKTDYNGRTIEAEHPHVRFVHSDAIRYLRTDNVFDLAFLDDNHEWAAVEKRLERLPDGCLAIAHDPLPEDRFPGLAENADFVIDLPRDKRSGGFAVWKL